MGSNLMERGRNERKGKKLEYNEEEKRRNFKEGKLKEEKGK